MNTALAGFRKRTPRPRSAGPRRHAQGGGTLIEVLMASVILAILGSGIVGSINYGMFMMRLARENARATQIMLEKLETVRLYNWTEVNTPGFVPTNFTDYYDPQGGTNTYGAVYAGTLAVSNCPVATSYATNMRQFTVTIAWNTGGRINHKRSISTYVSRDGLQNYVY